MGLPGTPPAGRHALPSTAGALTWVVSPFLHRNDRERRMWAALPFFCLGGVLGSLILPAVLRIPSLGEVDLATLLGPWGGLAATEALLALGAAAILRKSRPAGTRLAAGATIGALAGALFLVSGTPWGITMGLTLWGAKGLQAVGIDLTGFEYWSAGWARDLLAGPTLAMHGALTDVGLLLGLRF